MHSARFALAVLLTAASASAEAGAQSIRGQVVDDSTGAAVSSVIVTLIDAQGSLHSATRTDSAGRFVLAADAPGSYRLHSKASGYEDATTTPIEVAAAEDVEVRFVVSRNVITIEAIEVTARSRPLISGMAMQGFHERRMKGQGFAITRADIEKRNAKAVTDLLRMAPGVRIEWRFGGSVVSIPGSGQRLRSECPVKVMVDGIEFRWGNATIDDIPTHDIEAIEIFRNLAELPPEMAGSDADCGVIAVWTRRGIGSADTVRH